MHNIFRYPEEFVAKEATYDVSFIDDARQAIKDFEEICFIDEDIESEIFLTEDDLKEDY